MINFVVNNLRPSKCHSAINKSNASNFILSRKLPHISAAVIMANINW